MAWHKWFVRGLVFSIVAGAVAGTLAYQHWTNPTAVRAQVLAKAVAMFPGAAVSLESASLRILGGIQIRDLHAARRDDPTAEVIHVPSAILYHDKEKVLDGQLSFRKIELQGPRLRVVRGADGQWNVLGLAAAVKPGQFVPTMVVHRATIQFEDHRDAANPFKLELAQANLTLINDPLDVVTIDGVAQSTLLGSLVVHGVWLRQANEFNLTIKTTNTPLNDALLARLACFCPTLKLHDVHVQGQANVQIHLAHRPVSEIPWSFNVFTQVDDTSLQHPKLPYALSQMAANLHYDGAELRLESLRARAGAATLTAQGIGRLPHLDQHFEGSLRLEHAEVDENLGQRLPENLQNLMRLYRPRGRVTVQADVARRSGQWTALTSGEPSRVSLMPEEVSACFERFPYPLEKVSGAIHCVMPQQRITADLIGYAGARPVLIKGRWQGSGTRIDMDYDITATAVPIDDKLVASLPETLRKTAQAFHLTGLVDVKAHVRRQPNDTKFAGEYYIGVRKATVIWDEFPYPLTDVSGFIDVTPTSWQFRDFQGMHGDSKVTVRGRSVDADETHAKPGVFVEISGKSLPLDADLRAAVKTMPALAKAWDTFQPAGRLDFRASIDRRGREPDELEVDVDVKGASVQPTFFKYPLHEVAGHFHMDNQRLEVRRLSAVHGTTRWYLDKGSVELHGSGALYAVLPELQAEGLLLDRDLANALPPKLSGPVLALRCPDPLRLKTRLIVSHPGGAGAVPDVYWDGQVWLSDAVVHVGVECRRVTGAIACVGRHNGRQLTGLSGNMILERTAIHNQPFRDVRARFVVKEHQPERLLVDLTAPIFGGDIAGQVSLDFRDALRYELNLTASQIDLQEFGRHNLGPDSKLSGFAVARLHLTGVGADPDTLDGHGTLDVPNGKLLNLPLLLDLIKFLGLRWPDRTMFEELHAQIAIRRRRMTVNHLELFGNALSFTGKGEINLDGTDLHLDMYPSWARIEQLLPPAVRAMPPTLSKSLLTVEARGKITGNSKDIKFTKKPLPVLVDPFLQMRERWIGTPAIESRPALVQPAPVQDRLKP